VYTVLGGLDGWKDEVLFPALPADAGPRDRAQFERAAALAQFFGGQARTDGAATTEAPATALPKLAAPTATAPAMPTAPRRKKKEGC